MKPVSLFVCKCSIYNFSYGAGNECVHVSVNLVIFKTFVTHFSESAVNVRHKVFKVVLSRLSDDTVSVLPIDVVKVTTTPTHRYNNSASKHVVIH